MPSNVATKPMNQSLQASIDSDDDFRPGCQSVGHRINGHQSERFFFFEGGVGGGAYWKVNALAGRCGLNRI